MSAVPVGSDDLPMVLCVGTSLEASLSIARLVQSSALVLVAADVATARSLLPEPAGGAVNGGAPGRFHDAARAGDLHVDATTREVRWGDHAVSVSPREFDLLMILAREPGRVRTFAELARKVWQVEYLGDSDIVLSAVKRLRRRLAESDVGVRIVSVRGVGFRLVVLT